MNKKVDYNVVDFSQSRTGTKKFSNSLPTSKELKSYLYNEIHICFLNFIKDRYFIDIYPTLKQFADDHHILDEQEESFVLNLFWWHTLLLMKNNNISIVEEFIALNRNLSNKALVTSWLRKWEEITPRFYYIGHIYNEYAYVVIDILTEETFDVVVYDPSALPAKKGEVVVGTMLPIGDELYFPITDFYHFDLAANKEIISSLSHYYDKYLENSSIIQAFIHVLSVTLQIEQIISYNNSLN